MHFRLSTQNELYTLKVHTYSPQLFCKTTIRSSACWRFNGQPFFSSHVKGLQTNKQRILSSVLTLVPLVVISLKMQIIR